MEVNQDNAEEEEERLGWSLLELEDTGILTQDAEPGGTTLVDACNGLNNLSCLAMLWVVHHCWPEESRFMFNCYRHWAQILLRHPSDAPVILLG